MKQNNVSHRLRVWNESDTIKQEPVGWLVRGEKFFEYVLLYLHRTRWDLTLDLGYPVLALARTSLLWE